MKTIFDLAHLADGDRLVIVQPGVIASVPADDPSGDHLFIDCMYHAQLGEWTPQLKLAAAKADTEVILQTLVANQLLNEIASVLVRFYVDPGDCPRGPRQWLYRYAISASDLPHDGRTMNPALTLPAESTIGVT